jgi:hypothetical protein
MYLVSAHSTRKSSYVFQKDENALYVAMDYNNTSSVGVLLDYMHSVDNRVRHIVTQLDASWINRFN